LRPGEFLAKGQWLTSANGLFTLTLQADGNLVLSRSADKNVAFWTSQTVSAEVTRLCFGLYPRRLVLWGRGAKALWEPKKEDLSPEALLLVGDDGNVAILRTQDNPSDYSGAVNRIWASNTKVQNFRSGSNAICRSAAAVSDVDPLLQFPASRGPTSSLGINDILAEGQRMISTNGRYALSFTSTANIVISTTSSPSSILFSQATYKITNAAATPRGLALTSGGTIELRDSTGIVRWSDGSKRNGTKQFVLTDAGGVQMVGDGANPIKWVLHPQNLGPRLSSGAVTQIYVNQRLTSKNGNFFLAMQSDGNLVLNAAKPPGTQVLWESKTVLGVAERLVLMDDASLLLLDARWNGGHAAWTGGSGGKAKANRTVELTGEGRLSMTENGKEIWFLKYQ
jgi:hypothetical protein